jgi:hypothetical protein
MVHLCSNTYFLNCCIWHRLIWRGVLHTPARENRTPACPHAPGFEVLSEHQPDSRWLNGRWCAGVMSYDSTTWIYKTTMTWMTKQVRLQAKFQTAAMHIFIKLGASSSTFHCSAESGHPQLCFGALIFDMYARGITVAVILCKYSRCKGRCKWGFNLIIGKCPLACCRVALARKLLRSAKCYKQVSISQFTA